MENKVDRRLRLLAAILVRLGVLVLGVPLHYFYGAVGRVPVAGLIGPVNESAWERFKLFYWPLMVLGLIEFPLVLQICPSYFLPKFFSMLTAFAAMSAFYYIPAAMLGGSLFISIASFAGAAIAGQGLFFVLASRPSRRKSELAGVPLIPWLDVKGGFYGSPSSGGR